MPRHLSLLSGVALGLVVAPWALVGQGTQTSSISGRVLTPDGTPVSGAIVRLTSPSLMGVRTVTTDASGFFGARLLPPGQYRIEVIKSGYVTNAHTAKLGLEQAYSPTIRISKEASATVEVIATSGVADKGEAKIAYNYTKDKLDTLPVGTNSALEALYLSPGVAKSIMSDKGGIEIRGSNATGSLTLVDGQNTMDNVYVGQRIKINMDAVEETQVLTGAIPAEYGYVEGGVINSITKSGGNEFSGSLRVNMTNQNWNAVGPLQDRDAILKSTVIEKSVTVGGPILKDKLWFFGSFFYTAPSTPKSLDGTNSGLPLVSYSEVHNDYRRELKLTYSPTSNHTITATYHNFSDAYNRDASGAGELGALSMFSMTGEFYTLSWRALFGDNLAVSAKYGQKTQGFGTDFNALAHGAPIYSKGDEYTYASGAWDPRDPQPDKRDNHTGNLKVTKYFDWGGNHELDLGYDYYKGITKSSGYQSAYYLDVPGLGSCNVNTYQVDRWHGDTLEGEYLSGADGGAGPMGTALSIMKYVPDTNTLITHGFYFNDKYTLNNHWNFNIGARFDRYNNSNLSKGRISSSAGISPRLGVKYDILGDNEWVLGLNFSRLLGRPMESVFQRAGYVFSPIQYQIPNRLAERPGRYSMDQVYDLDNYNLAAAVVTDSSFNVRFDPDLRMTTVDEWQFNVARTFKDTGVGTGYFRVNLVRKQWRNLVAQRNGMDGTVSDPVYRTQDIQYTYNEPLANREYKALEFDFTTSIKKVSVSGNVTWSEIYGNYNTDAGTSLPNTSPIYFNYPIDPRTGDQVYDPRMYGGLNGLLQGRIAGAAPRSGGMSPLIYNLMADYFMDSRLGRTTFGLVYQFRSGQIYSQQRDLNPAALPGYDPANPWKFSELTQVLGTPGQSVFEAVAYTDLAITHTAPLWKYTANRTLDFWVRLSIHNLWNHQQKMTWDVAFKTADTVNAPWVPKNPSFGQATRTADFADPRTLSLSVGLKF